MDFSNYWWQAADAPAPPTGIGNSLRFRGAQYLNQTQKTPTTANVVSISCWVKWCDNPSDGAGTIFNGDNLRNSDKYHSLGRAPTDGKIYMQKRTANVNTLISSVPPYRDNSAWYHILYTDDGAANLRLYVNGEEVPTTGTYRAGNYLNFGGAERTIGADRNSGGPFFYRHDGYIADFHCIDGQVLTPDDFGTYDANGVWVPKAYTGTYGANGCYLDFSDPADIGADRSGNGNDFTATGFDFDTSNVYSGSDLTEDSPTNNNPQLFNQNVAGTVPVSAGTTRNPWRWASSATAWNYQLPQAALPSSGKWWVESRISNGAGAVNNSVAGLVSIENAARTSVATCPGYVTDYGWHNPRGAGNAAWYDFGTQTDTGAGVFAGAAIYNSKIGFAIDCDAATPTIQLWQNNSNDWDDTAGWTLQATKNLDRVVVEKGLVFSTSIFYGHSQVSFYSTNPTATDNGYKNLYTQNLPAAPIRNGRDHFRAITDTGANILTAAQTAFPNGLWWIKDRANANNHQIVFDNSGDAFGCPTTGLTAYAPPLGDSVAWCWNVDDPGKCGVDTMTDVSTYEANQLFNHNLGQPADFIIALSGEASQYHPVYHRDATGWLVLNSNQAQVNPKESMFPTNTSTQIGVGTVAFALAGQPVGIIVMRSVPGYSAFGSYMGNHNANGPFVYTGFRPAFVMIKDISSFGNWFMHDSTTSPYNGNNHLLYANAAQAEISNYNVIDLVSNGFKFVGVGGDYNTTHTYIYAAFAENPFGGSNVSPANAR